MPLNFKIYRANINNAVATIINDERYILYDSKLLDLANNQTASFWSSISILAHEIGHHLSGHTLNQMTDNHTAELEADKFYWIRTL
ncbi:M48 family metalloprotease [Lacinutrix neustonica]|uniref:M48 family metalloprotease n=1 Tax=Lacinutrix neustonica TaxID=2980107 RepID=UPI0036F42C20